VVNQEPRLFVRKLNEAEANSKTAVRERLRRDSGRELYQELSRYYLRSEGRWMRPELLSKCKHGYVQCIGNIPLTTFLSVVKDLETYPSLRQIPDQSAAGTSTPITADQDWYQLYYNNYLI
jgi:hypothetical protein